MLRSHCEGCWPLLIGSKLCLGLWYKIRKENSEIVECLYFLVFSSLCIKFLPNLNICHVRWCLWEFIIKQDTALTEFLPSLFTHAVVVELFWFLFKHGTLVTMIVPRLCTLLVSLSLGQGSYPQCIQEPHGWLMPCCIVPAAEIRVVEVPQEDQGLWTFMRPLLSVYRGLICSVFLSGWPVAVPHYNATRPCPPFNPDQQDLGQHEIPSLDRIPCTSAGSWGRERHSLLISCACPS